MRDRAQDGIAGGVTAQVVDGFETIDIDEEHCGALSARLAFAQDGSDSLLEDRAVRKIGNVVVVDAEGGYIDRAGRDRECRAAGPADAISVVSGRHRKIAQPAEPRHANRRRRTGQCVAVRIDHPRAVGRTRGRIPIAHGFPNRFLRRFGALNASQGERFVGRPDQRRSVGEQERLPIADPQNALEFVVCGAQRASEAGVANCAQHRRSETRGFVVGERFDRAERRRIERLDFVRRTDRDQRNRRVARA